MEEKLYTAKEVNKLIGVEEKSPQNNDSKSLLRRARNYGLEIEQIPTKRGCPNLYRVLSNPFENSPEKWIPCTLNEDWEVSDFGRVRRKSTKKLLGSMDKSNGYITICCIDKKTGKQTNTSAHRMVFFSFYPEYIPQANDIVVDHINGKRTDNRPENLRAVSSVLNTRLRDENQNKINSLLAQILIKHSYDEVYDLLSTLL